ncbi:MAG: branched-chain amino acid ABC transporter permease [Anaerovoracaceae bacterium]
MSTFIQQIINGLSIGSVYALMAVGYSLVYSILNFSNFAHGGIIMLGAYFGFYAVSLISMPFAAALIIAALLAGIVAVVLERLAYRPLRMRNAPPLYFIISAMGASIFLENFVIATIGPTFKTYPNIINSESIFIGNIAIGRVDLLMFAISAVSLLILVVILGKTKIGLAIRATSYSSRGSQFMGVNVDRVIFVIFLLGGMLGGIAGMLFGIKYTVYPQIGIITNKSFIAAVFGGLGSLPGAVIGSILLGIIETMASAYISSSYRDLIAFSLLILVLVVKPTGLMGKTTEDKA